MGGTPPEDQSGALERRIEKLEKLVEAMRVRLDAHQEQLDRQKFGSARP
jgi:hypothetical protein